MGGFHFTVKDDFSAKLKQSASPASARAAHILAIQMAKDTEKYVPALTKSLINNTKVDGDTIIYPGPQSHYLYEGEVWVDPAINAAGFLTKDGWKSRKGINKVKTDKNLVFNKSIHSAAQDHWFEASKAQNLPKWKRVAERAFAREIKK